MTHIIVVHARQVVVNQRIGVNHLDRARESIAVSTLPPTASHDASASTGRKRLPPARS